MSRRRPVLIAGGGTAGHILPGLSIAEALMERGVAREDLMWVGSSRGQEAALVAPSGIRLLLLPGRGIQRRLTIQNVPAALGLIVAAVRALWFVGVRRPAVVLSLGGYASAAAAFAAVVWRIPLVLAEQNAVAGAANRVLGRFAVAAAVPFDGTGLPREVVTGNPVRDVILALRPSSPDEVVERQRAARRELGLPDDRLVVAAFAGSLGSRRINEAVAGVTEAWSDRADLAVYHVVGRRDWATFVRPAVDGAAIEYRPVEYEERMDLLLAAADVAVCRSGGTTVAELAVIGVPSVLVPLPIAPGDHQRANARALVDAGAALLLDDGDCTPEGLADVLGPWVADRAALAGRAGRAWALGRPEAAGAVADLVVAEAARGRDADVGGVRA